MPQGNVSLTIKDGALGLLPAAVANIFVTIGVCSLGTPNTLYSFGAIDDLTATLGYGPGVEAAAYKLALAGGTQYVMPITASVAGTSSAVTPTRIGASSSVMTTTGAPNDGYSVVASVVSAGAGQVVANGTSQVKISLDGGNTFGQAVLVPAGGTYAIPNTGLSLVFTVGAATLDLGDKFAFTCQAPYYSSTDLTAACAALFGDARTWGQLHLVGYPTAGNSVANATAAATMATSLATQMATAETSFRYVRATIDAPPSTDSDLVSAFATFADKRVRVVAGNATLTSPITGRQTARPWAWASTARLAQIRISESPGFVGRGPIPGVVNLLRDERKSPGLYDARFGCATTIIGVAGFYDDFGNVMAAAGSDFSFIMNGRVMDVSCTVGRGALLQFLNASVRVNSVGTILEQDARAIEKYVETALRAAVVQPGDASDCSVQVNRTDNILSTKLLRVKLRVVPLGYAQSISADIGFSNPTLALT